MISTGVAVLDLKNCRPSNDPMDHESAVTDVTGEFKEGFCFKINVFLQVD